MKRLYLPWVILLISVVSTQASIKVVNYTIKSGDTLYTIAHKHHTTIEEVRKANSMKKGEILRLGRLLKVPKDTYFPNRKKRVKRVTNSKKVALKSFNYKIKKGDSLYTIAHRYHTTINKIRALNGMKKGEILRVGKRLKVPLSSRYYAKKKKKKKKKSIKLAKSISTYKPRVLTRAKTVQEKRFFWESLFSNSKQEENPKAINIIKLAKKKLGKRYVWGAVGQKNTFDCSGFTKYVYEKNGIKIPRTSLRQSKFGKPVSRKELRKGDLVFFDTSKRRRGYVNHVGIYIGDNKFIHASSAKKKVVITSLNKAFYRQRFKGARRPSS